MTKQAEPTLVFTGREPGLIPWTLFGFILLSAFAHLFGFYLFQTVYPPIAHVASPPVQVSLLTPGTPEADALLRWVDTEDPALIAQPRKAAIPGLLDLPYVASYAAIRARPSLFDPPSYALPFPSGNSGLDLVELATPQPAPPDARPENAPTMLSLSGGLQGRLPGPLTAVAGLLAAQPGELRPARFLVGVTGQGETRYVFLQESSGDKGLDADARRVLEQKKFRHLDAPLAWGFATFSWGATAYARASPPPEPGP